MAIAMLQDVEQTECDGNIFSKNYDKNHCKNCYNGIKNFLNMPNLKQFVQKHYVSPISSTDLISAAKENLIKNDADPQHNELLLKETKNNVPSEADLQNDELLLKETKNNIL
jgi:hypothetical protein